MGKSQSAVANKIRLLSLPDEVQDALLKEKISERHARALINVPELNKQKELLKKVIEEKISVRKLEEEINKLYPKNKTLEEKASANEFLNKNPLSPTGIDVTDDQDNYGKVIIAPPQEEGQERFINYGEIEKEDNKQEISKDLENTEKAKTEPQPIIVPDNQSSLDSLLNIGQPTLTQVDKIENEIIKETPESDEYFQTTDLNEMEQPTIDIFKEINENITPEQEHLDVSSSSEENSIINIEKPTDSDKYSIEIAQNKIKQLVEELKDHEITISCDEMDFPETYQVIIKITKEKVE